MTKLQQKIAEDVFVRRFLRGLTGLILIFYTIYMVYKKATTDTIPIDGVDWTIILGSLSIWAAWEAARAYLNKKLQ